MYIIIYVKGTDIKFHTNAFCVKSLFTTTEYYFLDHMYLPSCMPDKLYSWTCFLLRLSAGSCPLARPRVPKVCCQLDSSCHSDVCS